MASCSSSAAQLGSLSIPAAAIYSMYANRYLTYLKIHTLHAGPLLYIGVRLSSSHVALR
jgi:hypothetical protein